MDIAPLVAISVITEPTNPTDFDIQRFGGQKLPEGNYNLKIKWSDQNKHIEGTEKRDKYLEEERLSGSPFVPSVLAPNVDAQALVKEFHGKGIYAPHPHDGHLRERVDTGKIIGQYWDRQVDKLTDTTWIMIVYSNKGTHIYPIKPLEENQNDAVGKI